MGPVSRTWLLLLDGDDEARVEAIPSQVKEGGRGTVRSCIGVESCEGEIGRPCWLFPNLALHILCSCRLHILPLSLMV